MSADPCPKGGDHIWRNTHETRDQVTHTCAKCGLSYTRSKVKI